MHFPSFNSAIITFLSYHINASPLSPCWKKATNETPSLECFHSILRKHENAQPTQRAIITHPSTIRVHRPEETNDIVYNLHHSNSKPLNLICAHQTPSKGRNDMQSKRNKTANSKQAIVVSSYRIQKVASSVINSPHTSKSYHFEIHVQCRQCKGVSVLFGISLCNSKEREEEERRLVRKVI